MTDLFNPVFKEMGARAAFDYAKEGSTFNERLSHCYRLGAMAFTQWPEHLLLYDGSAPAPEPRLLVHGSWHGPEAPTRINHCWVVLSGDWIWEPISALIYEPDQFYEYTKGHINNLYAGQEAINHMLSTGHFGPWPESEEHHG